MPHKDEEIKRAYHRDYNRVYMKKWREQNIEVARARDANFRKNNRLSTLIYSTRQTAKKKNLEHTITENDLTQIEYCPYTGIKIDWSCSGKHMANPSVDRIDNNKGYIPGNVEVVSNLANSMKNKATSEQLVSFAKEVLRRFGSTDD